MKHLKKFEDKTIFLGKKIVIVTLSDDWEGLYIDGELIEEGHSINYESVLKSMIKQKINLADYTFGRLKIMKNSKYYELSDDDVDELGLSNLPTSLEEFLTLLHDDGFETNINTKTL